MFIYKKTLLAAFDLWDSIPAECKDKGDCKPGDLATLGANVAQTALALVGTISLLFLIIAGITYITSGGNPEKIEKAKSGIFYSILGLVLSILSYAIISFIIGVATS